MGTRTSESGFTLVELMIASMITLVVMGVAFSTFKDALALNEAVVQIGDSSQNLRAGTNLLVRDLLQAGRNIPTGGISIPSGAGCDGDQASGPAGERILLQERRRGLDDAHRDHDRRRPRPDDQRQGDRHRHHPHGRSVPRRAEALPVQRGRQGDDRAILAADGSSFDVRRRRTMTWIIGDKANAIRADRQGRSDSTSPTSSGTRCRRSPAVERIEGVFSSRTRTRST